MSQCLRISVKRILPLCFVILANASFEEVRSQQLPATTQAVTTPVQTPSPSPAASPEPVTTNSSEFTTAEESYWEQEWLTSDWNGARRKLKAKGIDLEFRLTQSYQAVTSGARSNFGAYGGKFDTSTNFDMQKLAGWKGVTVQLRTETRFGRIPNILGAKLIPTTYLITPKTSGTVFAISAFNFTKVFATNPDKGEFIAIGAGRYYGFDGADSPFHGGGGQATFLHLAFNGTPTHGRLVPSVTNGANFAWLKKGKPFLTFSVRDAVGHATTSGIRQLFNEGATFISGINFPTTFGAKSGQQSLTGMITTRKFTPFDDFSGVLNPFPPGVPPTPKRGSWIVQYKGYQYFKEHKETDGTTTGWGAFWTFVVADGLTNKSGLVLTGGVGGTGPFQNRKRDRWGVAFSIDGVSKRYREQVGPLVHIDSEHVFEAFYNFSLTPFVSFSGDLQVIRPMLTGSGIAVLPGARMVINF